MESAKPVRSELTTFQGWQRDYPRVFEILESLAPFRHHALLALGTAYVAKSLSGRPLKGMITGVAALASLVALDRLHNRQQREIVDPLLKSALIKSRQEAEQLKREKDTLEASLAEYGRRLGRSVPGNGRCLFYACVGEERGDELCERALELIQTDDTVKGEFLQRIEPEHDVFKGQMPEDLEEIVATYCAAMRKEPYPYAQTEIIPAIAQALERMVIVYIANERHECPVPNNGFGHGSRNCEIALLNKHYWPVVVVPKLKRKKRRRASPK